MKKIILILFVLLSSIVIVVAGFKNAKKRVITIYNKTELKIDKIFFSEEDKESWVEVDFNKQKMIAESKSSILFDVSKKCYYDVKILAGDGQTYIWENNNLCETKEIYLFLEDENDESDSLDVK